MGKLDGTIALVTGASRSIGKAIAVALAREGAKLVLAARTKERLEATAAMVREAGSEALVVPTDVREEAQVEAMFDQTMAHYGRLDLLVNNSGIFGPSPIDEFPTQVWDDLMATSLRGAFLCSRRAFKIMKAQGGGRIINIGSISASRVREHNAAYSAAKFGLVGLTQTVALEGRSHGITCGIYHPGVTRQDDFPDMGGEAMMEQETAAGAVVFMASQPKDVNVLEMTQLPIDMPYLGRG
jgi:NAD(P)-dependent dehydrogenase (short-subunit alcohol dehydrogenase family)